MPTIAKRVMRVREPCIDRTRPEILDEVMEISHRDEAFVVQTMSDIDRKSPAQNVGPAV